MPNEVFGLLTKAYDAAIAAKEQVLRVQVIDAAGAALSALVTSAANAARTTASLVLPVQHIDAAGKVLPAGDDPSRAVYVQGANFAAASGVKVFGDPTASPAHSDPFSGDVLAAAAQGEAIAMTAPTSGKAWARLQLFLRWTSAPAAPVAGTPDAIVILYWHDGASWHILGHWPAKYIDDSTSAADMQAFSNYSEQPFPARATKFAVGVAGYVDGEFHVDIEGVA